MIFINCTIENPAFTSQTKETLKTKQNEFGSTCKLSDKILKKINSSGILNVLLEFLKFKEETLLMKKTDGKKVNAIKLFFILNILYIILDITKLNQLS